MPGVTGFELLGWQCELLPPLTWAVTAEVAASQKALLLFAGVSVLYLLVAAGIAYLFKQRPLTYHAIVAAIYLLSLILLIPCISQSQLNGQLSLPGLGLRLLFFHLAIFILVGGNWFVFNQPTAYPTPLLDYVRSQHGLCLLLYSPLVLPFILFGVPLVDADNHRFYWLSPLLVFLLYWLLCRFTATHAFPALGLCLALESLPSDLQKKIAGATKVSKEAASYQLLIARPGFRNAVAISPHQVIIIGIDLIRHLSTHELQAILLHEQGHIQDQKYVPRIGQLIVFFVLLYLVYLILQQAGGLSAGVSLLCFFVGLWGATTWLRQYQLRAEFVADQFVKSHSPALVEALVDALARLYQLNRLDQDHCKDHHAAHFDVDERQQMLATGQFVLQRKPQQGRKWRRLIWVVASVVLGLGLGHAYLTDSAAEQWHLLHDRYHQENNNQAYAAARKTIIEATALAVAKFGPHHYRTYLSLNDASAVLLRLNEVDAAEVYARQAIAAGQQRYPNGSLRQVRGLESLVAVRMQQNQWQAAAALYQQIDQLQVIFDADAYEVMINLVDWLWVTIELGEADKALELADELVRRYEDLDLGAESGYLTKILMTLYDDKLMSRDSVRKKAFFETTGQVIKKKYGAVSDEYALYLMANERYRFSGKG